MPTPNFLKYSTTPDSSGIKVGNYTIGVFSGGTYGPTSTTNYWNGITPPISGYTIYENKAANGPSIRVAADASVLIDYTRRLYSGSSVTTEYSALTYLNSLGTVACVNRDYEEIITSGLTLNLDAGFTPSYPKSGTTWTDISFSGNNGTLVNGPTFDLSNGGSIVFDGVDDYVSTTYNSNVAFLNRSPYTLEVFVNPLSVSQYPGWIDREANLGSGRDGYNLIYSQVAMPAGSVYVFTERFATGSAAQAATTLTTSSFFGNWSHLVSTYNGSTLSLYVNGILMGSSTSTGNITNGSTALQIGRRGVTSSSGKIAISRIYNRALTNVEILQNYQSQFPRFLGENIVTNGLVLYLDAGYRPSYPTTGTTWTNVSGVSGGTGTLTNGPTYDAGNGGTIDFDGVDDYVIGNTNLGLSGNPSFSISYFARWDGASFSSNFPSGVGNNSVSINNRGLSTTWRDGRIALDFWTNRFRANSALNVQTWYYVTFTKTPGLIGSTCKLYVNGQEVAGTTEGTNEIPNIIDSPLIVGRLDSTRWFNGKINNVSVYNRALTQTEITQNFNAQKPRFGL